ncbi:MAG: hypothetical protein KKI08_25865, partial [Armatimonadetes bacterium]|nr:hypothetical protein [Armatimonadota bacterium]
MSAAHRGPDSGDGAAAIRPLRPSRLVCTEGPAHRRDETGPMPTNLLFIFSDQQRAGDMGCEGNPQALTP